MRYVLGILSILFFTQSYSASAFQQFREYRIFGNEIKSVKLEPLETESPYVMHITLINKSGEIITISSDSDLKVCRQDLENIAGNHKAYAQIIVHENGETMNGVMAIQCSVFHF